MQLINFNSFTVIVKKQITYDLNTDKFKYLKREQNIVFQKVDINELNKRLNKTKRSNFYSTILVLVCGLSCLIILSFIGLKF